MAETQIEWTHRPRADGSLMPGYTFNPWIGCSKVHEGCRNCYAEHDFDTRRHVAQWGPNGTRIVTSGDNWRKPLKWNREAEALGERHLVFCSSLADVFEAFDGALQNHAGYRTAIEITEGFGDPIENICHMAPELSAGDAPKGRRWATLNDVRSQLFELIDDTPNLIWLLLTKRPENVLKMWKPRYTGGLIGRDNIENYTGKRHNVWIGTSISDQASADKQIPDLIRCRALCDLLFLSVEPLLDPVTLGLMGTVPKELIGSSYRLVGEFIRWVIVGGESGPNARPMHPGWARAIRDECETADVPFFFKQWGEWAPMAAGIKSYRIDDQHYRFMSLVGKKTAGNRLDGRQHLNFPEVT